MVDLMNAVSLSMAVTVYHPKAAGSMQKKRMHMYAYKGIRLAKTGLIWFNSTVKVLLIMESVVMEQGEHRT